MKYLWGEIMQFLFVIFFCVNFVGVIYYFVHALVFVSEPNVL